MIINVRTVLPTRVDWLGKGIFEVLNSNTLTTSCEELTHWKRLWCWEGLGAGGKGDDRGWDGWMASLTRWTWVWVNSGRWWWTGRPGVLRFMGSQRVRYNWATELNEFPAWQNSQTLHPLGEGGWYIVSFLLLPMSLKTYGRDKRFLEPQAWHFISTISWNLPQWPSEGPCYLLRTQIRAQSP